MTALLVFLALLVVTVLTGLGVVFVVVLLHEWGARRYGWP